MKTLDSPESFASKSRKKKKWRIVFSRTSSKFFDLRSRYFQCSAPSFTSTFFPSWGDPTLKLALDFRRACHDLSLKGGGKGKTKMCLSPPPSDLKSNSLRLRFLWVYDRENPKNLSTWLSNLDSHKSKSAKSSCFLSK